MKNYYATEGSFETAKDLLHALSNITTNDMLFGEPVSGPDGHFASSPPPHPVSWCCYLPQLHNATTAMKGAPLKYKGSALPTILVTMEF